MGNATNMRRNCLTGIEKLQLIQKISKENDRQLRVDKIVAATKLAMEICRRESRQIKVDEIVAKTKQAMKICQRESQQAKVDQYVKRAIAEQAEQKKGLTGIEKLQLIQKIKTENDAQQRADWIAKYPELADLV